MDEGQIEVLYHQLKGFLYWWSNMNKLHVCADDIDDAVQETLIKAFDRGYLNDLSQLNQNYLKQGAKNCLIDAWRKHSHIQSDHEFPNIPDFENSQNRELPVSIIRFLEQHKYGWIWLEILDRGCNLKTLSQVKGINYLRLKKYKSLLDKDLKEKFRGGGDTVGQFYLIRSY